MSTKVALAQEENEALEWIKCKVCDHSFVEGGTRVPKPLGVCCWCSFRGSLWRRYSALYAALIEATKDHPEDCNEKCCRVARLAREIMI
jgi:hypothetical protein